MFQDAHTDARTDGRTGQNHYASGHTALGGAEEYHMIRNAQNCNVESVTECRCHAKNATGESF